MELTALQQLVHQMYIAYYQRPADPDGLQYWVDQLEQNGDWTAVSAAFGAPENEENQALYGDLNREQTIAAIYQSAFNREAVAEEVAFWAASEFSATDLTFAIVNGAQNSDKATVDNKVAFSAELVAQVGTNAAYAELQDPKALLTAVTEETEVTADYVSDAVASGKVGEAFSLTANDAGGVFVGTANNDTFNAEAGSLAGTTIAGQAGNDTLNATLTGALTNTTKIQSVENVNFDWNAFGTATVDAANITGANNLTFTSSKLGYQGNVQVDNAGDNTIVAGTGANGALDVNGGKTVTVNAGQAKTVTVDAAATGAVSATVTAGAATTSIDVGSVTAFATTNVTGGDATTSVEINGTTGSSDVANVTVSKDATLAFLTQAVETVNVTAADGNKLTLADASLLDKATITSDGSVTLVAGSDELTTHTLTNSTAGLTIDLTSDTAADLSKVSYDLLNIKNALAGDLTVASGANLKAGVDLTSNQILATAGTSDVVNLNLTVDQTAIDVIDGTNDVETLNIAVDAADSETDGEIDVATLTAAAVAVSGASKVALGNITANSVDASAVTGEVTLTEAAGANGADITAVGSSTAKNTVKFATTTADTSYTGGEGVDVVTMAQTTGDSTVVLGNGANTYTNNTLTNGTAVVVGGAGVDTITVKATDSGANTANVVIQSGAGADVVSLDLAGANEQATVELGAGDDKLTLQTATSIGDTLVVDGGEGTDTIDLNGLDLTDGSITLSNVEVLDDSAGTATVDGALLNGKAFTIKGDGNLSTKLDVELDTAGDYDFSGLTLDATLTDGIGGLNVTGNSGNDTIVGTSGNDTIATGGGNDTVTGGAGVDAMTAGGGNDKFIFAAGDTGKTATTVDSITAFNTAGDDSISFGVAATATNYTEVGQIDTGTTGATFAELTTAANNALDGTVQFAILEDGTTDAANTGTGSVASNNAYAFFDRDMDGTADEVVQLVGVDVSQVAQSDFVAA